MRKRFAMLGMLAGLVAASGTAAQGGFVYRFADAGGTPTTNFAVNVGSTVDIQLYVQADGADATTLDTDGVYTAGVQVTYPTGAVGSAGAVNLQSIVGNSLFLPPPPAPVIDNTAGVGTLNMLADPGSPVVGSGGWLLLGTFTFLGTVKGDVELVAGDPPDADTFLLNDDNLTTFDIASSATATLTVSSPPVASVPEPATFWLLAIGGLGLLAWRGSPAFERGR